MQLFLAQRSGELTVIAGFPWFLDWGRDSLIFTRGLIATGQLREAASILRRFATYEQDGTLPNLLRGSEVTNRETSDAPLWLVVAIGDLADAKGDLDGDCGGRTLLQVARDILAAKQRTIMDRTSGLLHSSAHHSWMDTDNPACTPREGYPIEIQALWCRALRVVAELAKDEAASVLAEQVAHSIEHLYWREADSYYADCLHAPAGTPAALAVKDDHLRPNQWLGVSLHVLTQPERLQRMLTTSQCLLVPGAARSLAPQPVAVPVNRHSWLDVTHPYQSHYTGAEDSHRKPAYHNGTAWCWQYPLYAEAVAIADGSEGKAVARRLLSASAPLLSHSCIGQLPEIVDGDLPHSSRGCGAQAWSVSEWLRVWQEL
jgi:starch synthase (maltosyl-transferring)